MTDKEEILTFKLRARDQKIADQQEMLKEANDRACQLEQAIKRIVEAYLEVKAANDFSNEKCPSIEMAHEANKSMDQAIADAAKMVEDL